MDLAFDAFDLAPAAVRERFLWARRQGHPSWLWPDITIEQWREALAQIETVVREVLSGKPGAKPLGGDPDALGVACYTSGVGPLLGHWIEQGLVAASPLTAAILKLHLQHNRLRMERMTEQAVDIIGALASRGIAVTVLKGMHTGHVHFPEPGTRPASDMDLLIDGSAEPAANEILRVAGFQPGRSTRWPPQRDWRRPEVPVEPRSLCFVHADDPWSIDLQTSLNRQISTGMPMAYLDDAAVAAVEYWPVFHNAAVLPQPLLLLQLAVHASYGFENLTLLRLLELAFVIRRDVRAGYLAWEEFLAAAGRARSLDFTYPALQLCEELVPHSVPADVIARCRHAAPTAVRAVVEGLTPATAQRVDRCSLTERFMWTNSRANIVRQIIHEVIPPNVNSLSDLFRIYRMRAWRLARRTVTK